VTFEPEAYVRVAAQALAGAVESARNAGLGVDAIGISSQAQTYIPLDEDGRPLQKAIVWTDGRAIEEAVAAACLIPDFVQHSGFKQPLAEMFMPKVRHFASTSGIALSRVWKFVLLNEFIIYRLTGAAYGDETNQGMSGFYHIAARRWSRAALDFAGIDSHQLANVAPAGRIARLLTHEWCNRLGLEPVPVYSCGNDQSCSAAGAGLAVTGDVLCNFGTAMVVYALKDQLPDSLLDKQIAGINPLTGRYFLLGLESECGNVLDWAHRVLYPGRDFATMMDESLRPAIDGASLPRSALPGGGRIDIQGLTVGREAWQLVRALLELYAETFGSLFEGVTGQLKGGSGPATRAVYAAGGLSRSDAWLGYLSRKFGVEFRRTATEQPGLVGVARIIKRQHTT
jgi:sugar (pentulose or hexulose) kinase